jgi:glycosyltransferase involved in cell wall biosynthesis
MNFNKLRLAIIIPAHNEEKSIESVISSIKRVNANIAIFVVNDGSVDKTSHLAKKTNLVTVVDLPLNVGIGGAVQTGFKLAYLYDYDFAIQMDGDGQHDPQELIKLITPVINGEADVVIGSRFLDKKEGFKSTFMRRFGIKIFRLVNLILINQKITDSTSGFRAYNRKAFEFLSRYYPSDYPEPEAIVLLGKNKFIMKEISVRMFERDNGKSSIRGLRSVYYMIKVLLAMFITFIRPVVR